MWALIFGEVSHNARKNSDRTFRSIHKIERIFVTFHETNFLTMKIVTALSQDPKKFLFTDILLIYCSVI